jgi:hypothetical protein
MGNTAESECVEALQRAAEELGRSPSKAEYEDLQYVPASATIINCFGSWNAAKQAAGLQTFSQGNGGMEIPDKPPDVNLPDEKDWKELSSNQRWYYKNRERDIKIKDERKARIRRWLYEYKRDSLACERCGEEHPAALDFHHTGDKDLGIARMVNQGYSEDSILAEIDDCEVLCANCHRKHHFTVPPDLDRSSQHS